MMSTTPEEHSVPESYLVKLRELAQSILAGVQRLEEARATVEDDGYSKPLHALEEADSDVWALVEWIEEGRSDG